MESAQADLFCESTKNTLSTYFEKVTPTIARTLLDKNYENNRKVNQRVVESYAQQMIKGLWHEDSGETIKISQSGKIIDGQHRLFGIIRAAELSKKFKGLNFLIIEGVPDSAINSIDDGFKRTLANAFSMSGKALPNQSAINGALKVLWVLKYCDEDNKHFETINSRRVSTAELMYFYDGLPKFKEVAHKFFEKFKYTRIGKVLPIGIALAMYYLYHDVDEEHCFSIFKSFETGLPMDDFREHSPTYHISENARRHRELRIRIRPYTNIQLFLWCYTKTLEGKPVKMMPKTIEWKFSEDNLVQAQAIKKLRKVNA
jgi:hypothetical protein